MFKESGGITYINGKRGIYNGRIENKSVRYARNAVDNYKKTYEICDTWEQKPFKIPECGIKKMTNGSFQSFIDKLDAFADASVPAPQFKMRYAVHKAGQPDTMAAIAAAFEEMGKKASITVKNLTNILQQAVPAELQCRYSAEALDLNKDGKIDTAEYGASILAEDMLSKDNNVLKYENITGEINNQGQESLLPFAVKKNSIEAQNIFRQIYNKFNLGAAEKKFLSSPNNLIK